MSTCIIVPARNEEDNILELIPRIVKILKPEDQIVIVEGGSSDRTFEVAQNLSKRYFQVHLVKQTQKGKFNAVLDGLSFIEDDYVMVWDADATVNFDQNCSIYLKETYRKSLVMGDRLRGKREKNAMRPINWMGNWAFAVLWSVILRKRPIDLLCGSKKFPREVLSKAPDWLLKLDPYGDFTMIIMSKQLDNDIVSLPVLYHARTYGHTNIHRWRGGVVLLWVSLGIIQRLLRGRFWN